MAFWARSAACLAAMIRQDALCLVMDMRDLEYRWGNSIDAAFDAIRRHYHYEWHDIDMFPPVKVEISDDFGVQQAHCVSANRVAKPRVKFLSDRGSADSLASLQDLHAESRAREVRCANKPVVPSTGDHCIVGLRRTFRCGCHSSDLILLRKCETGRFRARYLA